MNRLLASKSDRQAMADALRDMKRSGARHIDLRQLPVNSNALRQLPRRVRP